MCALVDHVWVGATATVSSEEGSNKVCGNICIFSAISFQQICTVGACAFLLISFIMIEVHDSRIYAILPVGNSANTISFKISKIVVMWCTSADGKIYVISCASFLVSHKVFFFDSFLNLTSTLDFSIRQCFLFNQVSHLC